MMLPFFLIALILAAVMVVIAVTAAKRGAAHWATNRFIDWVLFLIAFASFVFTSMLNGRMFTFADEANISIIEVMGGQLLNVAVFFLPVILFVASLLLLIRLIQNLRNPVRASVMTDKDNYGKSSRSRR